LGLSRLLVAASLLPPPLKAALKAGVLRGVAAGRTFDEYGDGNAGGGDAGSEGAAESDGGDRTHRLKLERLMARVDKLESAMDEEDSRLVVLESELGVALGAESAEDSDGVDAMSTLASMLVSMAVECWLDEAHKLWRLAFEAADVPAAKAKLLAEQGTKRLGKLAPGDKSLTYGEVDFFSIGTILAKEREIPLTVSDGTNEQQQRRSRGLQFYDIGSGTGRAVIAAALLQPERFEERRTRGKGGSVKRGGCKGVEILRELHDSGVVACDAATSRTATSAMASVQLMEGDFFSNTEWLSADVVFANSTCFGTDLMSKLSKHAEGMKPGARFISLTIGLTSPEFKLISKQDFLMSWGQATALIHERL
jgi:hypothetical protein